MHGIAQFDVPLDDAAALGRQLVRGLTDVLVQGRLDQGGKPMTTDVSVIAGRFQLADPLGKGNMGEVYRALDLQAGEHDVDRIVAVKLVLNSRYGPLGAGTSTSKAAQRFAREVAIMRRLHHPNLPRTIDGGVDASGRPYLVMEYLNGRELSELIEGHPQLPASWVAALGAQIASGLAAAHAEKVVHRDLKPANVIVVPGGVVKVLDFGLGQIVDEDGTQLTSSGVTVGTARYMAPEQFRGSTVTPAADLYALGCVLFELLTGVPPFHGGSAYELGEKHRNADIPPLRTLRQDVPARSRSCWWSGCCASRRTSARRARSRCVTRSAGSRPVTTRCPAGPMPTR